MIIGITGNSGSGKSKISKIVAQKINAKIIDADKIAKELFYNESTYYKKIEKNFGENISRKELSELVYNDKEKLKLLNFLGKKYILKEIKNIIKKNKEGNLVLDVPLLFESNLDKVCNKTIGVIADKNRKIERIIKRDNIEQEEAIARLKIQNDDEYYKSKADFIIVNNEETNLELQIENILKKINKKNTIN